MRPSPADPVAGLGLSARAETNPTRLGLLAGAARAFADAGVQRSTMQSVAAAAGVAKATLYNYFRTKDEVVRALLALEIDRLTALAAGLLLPDALTALADELAVHPVLRRMADTEPDTLHGLLGLDADRWTEMTARLGTALEIDDDAAELTGRWLLGVVLQPGRSSARHRQAARLAAALAPPVPSG